MTGTAARSDAAGPYVLRIAGHLDERWSTWFGGMTVTHEQDGTTTLHGAVVDQAELHGVLAKVRDIGATLISVLPADTGCDGGCRHQQDEPHPAIARMGGWPTPRS